MTSQAAQHIALGHRDLTFIAPDPSRTRTLSAAQVQHYADHGYITPVDVLPAEEAADLRAYFDDLIQRVVDADDPRNGYSINCYHLVCQRLYDLALDPRILDLVEDILGPRPGVLGHPRVLQAAKRRHGSTAPSGRRVLALHLRPLPSRYGSPSTTPTTPTRRCTSCPDPTGSGRSPTTSFEFDGTRVLG